MSEVIVLLPLTAFPHPTPFVHIIDIILKPIADFPSELVPNTIFSLTQYKKTCCPEYKYYLQFTKMKLFMQVYLVTLFFDTIFILQKLIKQPTNVHLYFNL